MFLYPEMALTVQLPGLFGKPGDLRTLHGFLVLLIYSVTLFSIFIFSKLSFEKNLN